MSLRGNCLENWLKPRFVGLYPRVPVGLGRVWRGSRCCWSRGCTSRTTALSHGSPEKRDCPILGETFSWHSSFARTPTVGALPPPFRARTQMRRCSVARVREAGSPEAPGSPPGYAPENSDSCIACATCRGVGPCEMGVSTLDFPPPCLLREQPFLRPRRSRKQMSATSSGSFVLIRLRSPDPSMAVGFQDSALSSFSPAGWCWDPHPHSPKVWKWH